MDATVSQYRLTQLINNYSAADLSDLYRVAKYEAYGAKECDAPDAGFWAEIADLYSKAVDVRRRMEIRALPTVDGKPVGRVVVDIERVKDRLDLVDVVGRHVELRRIGRIYKGLCPFHSEKTPSFHVFAERQRYRCFGGGCGANGDVIDFVMRVKGLGLSDALKALATEAGIPWQEPHRRTARWGVEI